MGQAWVACVAVVGLAGASLTGCSRHERVRSEPIRESVSLDAGAAESARVQVELGAGELRILPGSAKLLEADFRFGSPEMKPEVKYDVAAGRGYLTLRQPSVLNAGIHGANESVWELRLNNRLPTELRIKVGAGKGTLKLAGLALTRLDIEMGAGQVDLDLNGKWEKDLDAQLNGGVGELVVQLPRDIGVRVKATGGIGDIKTEGLRRSSDYWVNDEYGKSGIDLRLDVRGGIGTIRLIG
jgi:hypothetical protein